MGVPGLWDLLRPAGHSRSLTHLAVVDGFQKNDAGHRGFRVGVDASIWFFHAAYGREGENPELRTLFFRCSRLLGMPFLPLFVFDGPKRPSIKRNKRISGNSHWLTNGMKNIIEAFGFEWKIAPGEAEAELAFLNRAGFIDAVLSDDVDTFVFGGTVVIRNPSSTLSGNRAHQKTSSTGKEDGNHAVVYKSCDFEQDDINLTHGGLILIAILSGGDYHPAGLPRCGPNIAHGLAKCGFGDRLLHAAQSMSRDDLADFLSTWRQDLRDELRTNSRGIIGRKHPSLAKSVPEDFPDIDILLSYTNPITSESEGKAQKIVFVWDRKLDLGRIANICELYFEWGVRSVIIKRFRSVLWPTAVLRLLREEVLVQDRRPSTASNGQRKETSAESRSNDTSMGLSSLQLADEDDDKLIVKIHSSRTHVSTDGLLEYRLEIAPKSLVHSAEAGIKDIRPPLVDDLDDDDLNEDTRRTAKSPPDPLSHFRVWIPACMVELVETSMVEAFQEGQKRRKDQKAKRPPIAKESSNDIVNSKIPSSRVRKEASVREIVSSPQKTMSQKSKRPPIKEFFAVSKKGGNLTSDKKSKPAQVTDVVSSTPSSIVPCDSKIIQALDKISLDKEPTPSQRMPALPAQPFPITFDSDSDDLFVDTLTIQRHKSRSFSTNSDSNCLEKSPRKSVTHVSPRSKPSHKNVHEKSNARPSSPTRPVHSLPMKETVIELSSDSDGEQPSNLKPNVAPLLLVKARAASRLNQKRTIVSKDIIDLT